MLTEPFVGEVRLFRQGGLPAGWAACNGLELPIDEYQPLFNLLGWRHGGDRMHTFALPLLEQTDFTFAMAVDGIFPPRPDEEPMDHPYVGEIRLFGGNFVPAGWALCDRREQTLPGLNFIVAVSGLDPRE